MAKRPKQHLHQLPLKKQKYAHLRLQGLTKKDAMMKAGYSEATAHTPAQIETADFKAIFQDLVRKKIPVSKIIKRVADGLDAVETKFFTHNGVVTDSRDTVLWNERRQAAELAAQMGGYWNPRHEIEQTQKIDERTLSRFADIAERLQLNELDLDERRKLAEAHVPIIDASTEHK